MLARSIATPVRRDAALVRHNRLLLHHHCTRIGATALHAGSTDHRNASIQRAHTSIELAHERIRLQSNEPNLVPPSSNFESNDLDSAPAPRNLEPIECSCRTVDCELVPHERNGSPRDSRFGPLALKSVPNDSTFAPKQSRSVTAKQTRRRTNRTGCRTIAHVSRSNRNARRADCGCGRRDCTGVQAPRGTRRADGHRCARDRGFPRRFDIRFHTPRRCARACPDSQRSPRKTILRLASRSQLANGITSRRPPANHPFDANFRLR